MSGVEIFHGSEQGQTGLGIRVSLPATVQDLLDAWQPLCDDQTIFKQYARDNHALCKGCQRNCCHTAYVIPDLVSFRKMAAFTGLEPAEFVTRYFQAEKLAVGLLRMIPEPCIFLRDNICSIYPVRSLICRFYLCTPLLGQTEQLIYKIAWSGAAATQVCAERQGLISAAQPGASSFDRLFLGLLDEYRHTPGVASFLAAAEYSDISLHHFLEQE